MDRIIEVKVNGNFLTKDNKFAGTQGEANVTGLRIEFDDGWDGYAKTITWWDAKGENPTGVVLTANLIENIVESTRIYMTMIPAEPLAIHGTCIFSIDGYINGKRQRSAYGQLVVKPGPTGEDLDIEIPTPSQIEQLQVQIDALMPEIQEAILAAEKAENSAKSAEESKEAAKNSESAAGLFAASANQSAVNAESAANNAAAEVKEMLSGYVSSAESAKTAAEAAQKAAEFAADTAAKDAASEVESRLSDYVDDAENAKVGAEEAKAAAEKARDEAQEIAGGDFASTAYVDTKASEAENNANQYTDQKFSAIPTPDVSGQIGTHNEDPAAHEHIRNAIPVVSDTTPECDIWVDPSEESESFYTRDEADVTFATKEEVAAIPLGITMTLLWENASPTSEFAAQDVALDLTEYSGVLVIPNRGMFELFMSKDVVGKALFDVSMYDSGSSVYRRLYKRGVSFVDSGINFSDCFQWNLTGTNNVFATTLSTVNGTLVPRYIYGIKGVQA